MRSAPAGPLKLSVPTGVLKPKSIVVALLSMSTQVDVKEARESGCSSNCRSDRGSARSTPRKECVIAEIDEHRLGIGRTASDAPTTIAIAKRATLPNTV